MPRNYIEFRRLPRGTEFFTGEIHGWRFWADGPDFCPKTLYHQTDEEIEEEIPILPDIVNRTSVILTAIQRILGDTGHYSKTSGRLQWEEIHWKSTGDYVFLRTNERDLSRWMTAIELRILGILTSMFIEEMEKIRPQ